MPDNMPGVRVEVVTMALLYPPGRLCERPEMPCKGVRLHGVNQGVDEEP